MAEGSLGAGHVDVPWRQLDGDHVLNLRYSPGAFFFFLHPWHYADLNEPQTILLKVRMTFFQM